MEAVARLGRDIGKPEDVCARWESRSKELIKKIVEKFWDGERWFAFNAKTGARSDTATISLYIPLILGKRLPQEIIDKSIDFMFGPDGFATPYGLATEGLTSDYFRHQFTQGSIIVPAEFIMVLALEACGRRDLAERVAKDYCAILRDAGFYHIHNALTGKGDRSLTAFGEPGLFWSAWASSCYRFLAAF
jgi:glycogen debranching enzyme